MYPNSLHFIKYKSSYLGQPTKNKVFAFIKSSHAEFIKSSLQYENFKVTNSENTYKISPNILKKPINKRFIRIQQYDPNVSFYFTHVNNTDLVLIDDMNYKNEVYTLYSNYSLDIDLMDWTRQYHFERLYLKEKDEKINYEDEFENMIIQMINIPEEDYEE